MRYRKRAYHADAIRLSEETKSQVLYLLNDKVAYAVPYGPLEIMVRFSEPAEGRKLIDTIAYGDWVVTGENGLVKVYTDEQFHSKYEVIF